MLQAAPLTVLHCNTIEMLATQTIDTWDQASGNQTAHGIEQEPLLEHAAHTLIHAA